MIPYALSKNSMPVGIQDVPRGLACNCICPACSAPLIARKGKRKSHHFAHYRQPECTNALESSLHLMAKAVLKRSTKIVLPPIYLHGRERAVEYARLYQYGSVRAEAYLQGMVPDLILETPDNKVLVEIAVSHSSRSDKIWKLQQARLAAIEIDVLDLHLELAGMGKGGDLCAFSEAIIQGIRHKKWLFNPKQHALEYQCRERSDRKKVKHKQFDGRHHHIVESCPEGKRFRRSGPREGCSYANVFSDCLHCSYCFEIEYAKKHVGYRQIATQPAYVYCLGHK
ncbi:MAG: hypothetical protein KDD15_26910 [Lewinella sp.]|nr:hypothetical protein [Lewinella sp.]